MISIVVAHDEHRAIGHRQWMPWNLPEDLKHFRQTTLHGNIVMGRVTFDAMKTPLPKRHTYVITTNMEYTYEHEDVTVVHDFTALLAAFQHKEEVLFICGGAKIYQQALPYADELWVSLVDGEHEADTYFPAYDVRDFVVLSTEKKEGFTIVHYRRIVV